MKIVRWFQETLTRRRRRRPARRPRFADAFAAALVIKPLESRVVLNGAPIIPLVGTELALVNDNLVIRDVGGSQNDTLTIQADSSTSNYVISDANNALSISGIDGASLSADGHTAYVPFAALIGDQIIADTGGGDDSLSIDFTLGSFTQSINFLGGDGDDSLAITGFGMIATYAPASIAGSGSILVGPNAVSFSGLEPIDFNVMGGTFVLDLGGTTSDNVTIEESTLISDPSLAALKVSGTVNNVAFENVRVRGSSLTINTHGGNDTVTVEATGDEHLNSSLTIQTGTESGDKIVINGDATFSGLTTLSAARIELNGDVVNAIAGSAATTVNVSSPGQIQDGIDVAAAGATVNVGAGTYAENLTIDVPLSLVGPNSGISAVTATRVPEAQILGSVAVVTAGAVRIDGFTIEGSVTDPGADLVIENNFITATGTAVDISSANSAIVRDNQIVSTSGSGIDN